LLARGDGIYIIRLLGSKRENTTMTRALIGTDHKNNPHVSRGPLIIATKEKRNCKTRKKDCLISFDPRSPFQVPLPSLRQ
jgi:hypothetical protein